MMLTGDHPGGAPIAAAVNLPGWQAQQKPQDKAAWISRQRTAGKIAGMVGDGVNDAPAPAAADVSFAIGGARFGHCPPTSPSSSHGCWRW